MGNSETSQDIKQPKMTFTDRLRVRYKGFLDPIGMFLNRLGITPNMMTMIGLLGNLGGAILIAYGYMTVGGLVLLLMGSLDAIDGTMARLRGETTDWGAFVDSVSDRYSELIVFAGLLVYYLLRDNTLMVVMTFAAAVGAVMVSYTRARALSLGYEIKIGIMTRVERYFILTPLIIIGLAHVGVILVAIFANITALQRVFALRKETLSE